MSELASQSYDANDQPRQVQIGSSDRARRIVRDGRWKKPGPDGNTAWNSQPTKYTPYWRENVTIILYGLATFLVVFGGGVLGLLLGRVLPEEYRDDATQKIVQTATGMISLLTALVLGLLVATAKNKYDTSNQQVEQFAASLMQLNRELTNYGAEAKDPKALLRKYTIAKIAETWPGGPGPKPGPDDPPAWKLLESLQQSLTGLAPQTESRRPEATRASQTAADLVKTAWIQAAQKSEHVQHPFVLVMIVWLFVLFVSFGLFAPRNTLG
jgi:hypothetical protein